MEIDFPSARRSPLAAAAPRAPRASWPSRRKMRRKNRRDDITPIRLRPRLRRQPRPARTRRALPARPSRPSPAGPAAVCPAPPSCPSLHFSPCGEAKCVSGPAGRGASRLARAGVLDPTSSTPSQRNEVIAVLSRASPLRWGEMQARRLRPRRVCPAEKSHTGCAGAAGGRPPAQARGGGVLVANPVSEWPFGSPLVRKARTTNNSRPVTACLPGIARNFSAFSFP